MRARAKREGEGEADELDAITGVLDAAAELDELETTTMLGTGQLMSYQYRPRAVAGVNESSYVGATSSAMERLHVFGASKPYTRHLRLLPVYVMQSWRQVAASAAVFQL